MKFKVKNIGKVKKAKFEFKPLTIFIGKNGSGKTYIASALWGVINYLSEIFYRVPISSYDSIINEINNQYPQNIAIINKIKSELSEINKKEEIFIYFSKEEIKHICDYLNLNIKENISNILKQTFNFDFFENSDFDFSFERKNIKMSIRIKTSDYDKKLILNLGNYGCYINSNNFDDNFSNHFYSCILIEIIFNSLKTFFRTLYIPAARTGLMFITHDIVQNQFSSLSSLNQEKENQKNDLTAPLNYFISKIHQVSRPKSEIHSSDYFNQIMNGKLVQREGQYRFDFQPNGLDRTVPLSASSSLVTELSALSALEGIILMDSFIILEEPEAHLHLSAQREMAKLIVRLINEKKCRILLTTHSDTFLQQINNLIMLEKLSKNNQEILKEFQIQNSEVISRNDVAVYDFQCDGDETKVEKLKCSDYGFVAQSMNKILIELTKQTQSIIKKMDNLES